MTLDDNDITVLDFDDIGWSWMMVRHITQCLQDAPRLLENRQIAGAWCAAVSNDPGSEKVGKTMKNSQRFDGLEIWNIMSLHLEYGNFYWDTPYFETHKHTLSLIHEAWLYWRFLWPYTFVTINSLNDHRIRSTSPCSLQYAPKKYTLSQNHQQSVEYIPSPSDCQFADTI